MDISSGECFSDLEMENQTSIIHYCQMMVSSPQFNEDGFNYNNISDTCYDSNLGSLNIVQMNDHIQGFQPVSSSGSDPPPIWDHGSGWSTSYCLSSSKGSCGSGQLISFGSSESEVVANDEISKSIGRVIKAKEEPVVEGLDHDYGRVNYKGLITKKSHGNKSDQGMSLCSQEHVLAERRRREKMAQRFHALSALIPGLKKMDKASILGDAAKYLKQLEEQVKQLEQQTYKRTVESVVLVNKTRHQRHDNHNNNSSLDDDDDDDDENFKFCMDPLLEIEARASNKNVLIRIHCQKDKGIIAKALNEIDKLHLTILNSNTMPFGSFALDITIIAQMKEEFKMKMKEVAMHLRQTLGRTTIPSTQ